MNDPNWPGLVLAVKAIAWSYTALAAAFCGALALLRWSPASRDVFVALLVGYVAFREASERLTARVPPVR